MGKRGGRKQRQNNTTNYNPFVVVKWQEKDYLCTNPSLRREIEDAVRDQAPDGAYHAVIKCGWHESKSDGRNHATVHYKIRLPNGGTKDKTEHIYP